MTAYFDSKHSEVTAIEKLGHTHGWQQLAAVDAALVWDVTLATESPGFPEDLRAHIHACILKYSVECQPVNAKGRPEYEDWSGHCRAMNKFVWDLHTLFHEVSQRLLPGFSDDPRSPMRALFNRGEEFREQLAETVNPGDSE